MIDVGTAIAYLELDTSRFTGAFRQANNDLSTFEDSTATAKQKVASLASGMSAAGKTLTAGVTMPLVGLGTAMVHTTQQFQAGMSEVAAISGATGEDLDALTAKAKEMGAKTKFSASESAEALKYMAMAGWDTQSMLDGLEGVMNLAAASGESLGATSDIVTDALTALGLTAADSAHFADILATASSRANTNVSLMGGTFKYVAPVAGALGYSAEDLAVAIGLMANSGIKGTQAGTALRGAFSRLIKPTDDVATLMEQMDFQITNADGSMKSLDTIMQDLRAKFGGLSEAEKASAAATMFGQEAMSGMLAIINASEADYNNLKDAIYNADGAANTMSDTMINNLSGQMTILKSTIEGISISFGEIMVPVISKVVSWLQSLATWLNNTSDNTKQIITIVATVLAALGPLLLVGSKLINGILKVNMLTGMMGGSLTALTGPIGIVIGVIAALAAAFVTNFGGIRDTVTNIMGIIGDTISTIVSNIKSIWDSNLYGIRDIVSEVMTFIEETFSSVLTVIEDAVKLFSDILTGDWSAVWEDVNQIFEDIWTGIKTALGGFLDTIVDSVIKLGANLYVKAKDAWNNFWNGAKELWQSIKDWFEEAKEDPIGTLKKLGESLFNIGKDIIEDLWDGLKNAWESVKSWFEGIGTWIKDKLTFWKSSVKDAENAKNSADQATLPRYDTGDVHGYAKGLSYVPYDGFPAILHKGERVMTAAENRAYNSGSTGSQYQFNFYSPQEKSPAEQARAFRKTMNDLLFTM